MPELKDDVLKDENINDENLNDNNLNDNSLNDNSLNDSALDESAGIEISLDDEKTIPLDQKEANDKYKKLLDSISEEETVLLDCSPKLAEYAEAHQSGDFEQIEEPHQSEETQSEQAQSEEIQSEEAQLEEAKSEEAQSEETEQPKTLSNEEVTGYTASLWKYLPIPSDEPEPAPEYINSVKEFPDSKVIAARVRGKKHKHEGTNCDDWYEMANFGRITFIAVSDGAGSKKFSRIGARVSCKTAVGYLVKSFEEIFNEKPELKDDLCLPLSDSKCMESCSTIAGIVQQAVIHAHDAVEAAFYSRVTDSAYESSLGRELQLNDFSATLLVTALIPVSETTKEHLIISCQIGDGMIATLNSDADFDKSVKLMGEADSGDYSGETDFLTSSKMKNIETLQHRTKIARTVVDTIMIMSDGVSDDYFPNETQMHRLYYDLIANGIIEKEADDEALNAFTQNNNELVESIPDPQVFPWVNDQNIKVSVQYTNRIIEATGLTLEDIWKDYSVLYLAKAKLEEDEKQSDPGERLKVWLDNYVERGSFDDRTLVVVTI